MTEQSKPRIVHDDFRLQSSVLQSKSQLVAGITLSQIESDDVRPLVPSSRNVIGHRVELRLTAGDENQPMPPLRKSTGKRFAETCRSTRHDNDGLELRHGVPFCGLRQQP